MADVPTRIGTTSEYEYRGHRFHTTGFGPDTRLFVDGAEIPMDHDHVKGARQAAIEHINRLVDGP